MSIAGLGLTKPLHNLCNAQMYPSLAGGAIIHGSFGNRIFFFTNTKSRDLYGSRLLLILLSFQKSFF